MLKETGREAGNWVNSDQAIWFLREITGMENAEMSWKFFIPTIKAFPIGQVEAMLMVMYDGNGVLLKESTRLVAVRYTRIGRDMSYSAVRQRYTQEDAPGGSLMYEMHWNELPMVEGSSAPEGKAKRKGHDRDIDHEARCVRDHWGWKAG